MCHFTHTGRMSQPLHRGVVPMSDDVKKAKLELTRARLELDKALLKLDAGELVEATDLKSLVDKSKALLDINGVC